MTAILAALLFPATIRDLDSTDFTTRHAARLRLTAAGWVAYPALTRGARTPEGNRLCREILDDLSLVRTVHKALLAADDHDLLRLKPLALWALRKTPHGWVKLQLCDHETSVADFDNWLSRDPWLSGSEAGDIRAALEALR